MSTHMDTSISLEVKRRPVIEFSPKYWSDVLDLACQYGWEPMETQRIDLFDEEDNPSDPIILESYLLCQRRLVTEEGAKNLAEALARVLADIPDKPVSKLYSEERYTLQCILENCRAGSFALLLCYRSGSREDMPKSLPRIVNLRV